MPQGDKRSSDWEFYDATYDGYWNEELQGGLGQLTDGKIGAENFKMGYYDYERSKYSYFIKFEIKLLLMLLQYYFAFRSGLGWMEKRFEKWSTD